MHGNTHAYTHRRPRWFRLKCNMVCGPVQIAKRALVNVICALAHIYGVCVVCKRDSPDEVVLKDFRRLALKAHPDRGGKQEHQQQLNDARLEWEAAKKPRSAPCAPVGTSIVPLPFPVPVPGKTTAFRPVPFCLHTRAFPVLTNGSDSMPSWQRACEPGL